MTLVEMKETGRTMPKPVILDCTLRDGGYYNAWDFPEELINLYLEAIKAAEVDIVELGFRFLKNSGFKGACAFTTDAFIRSLRIPEGLQIAVMVNGADLLSGAGLERTLGQLFSATAAHSPVQVVRIACHYQEFRRALPASAWLSERGYKVGFNLMQISDRGREEVTQIAREAAKWPIDVLYFADSAGSMAPDNVAQIIAWLREVWPGPIGFHAHDNMGLALQNTLRAHHEGAIWLDATVTGMGRGPGNTRTEELMIEAEALRRRRSNLVPLLAIIRKHFKPMKEQYGWGTNPFYYLSGKYGIHPTYIQEMLNDARFTDEDIFAAIEYLRAVGGKRFSHETLEMALQFYVGKPVGTWAPASLIAGREVLLLGTGPGAARHRMALEAYIRHFRPVVIALNTQSAIDGRLIDIRVACHPIRLLADGARHATLDQPLITPASMLPAAIRLALGDKVLLDFGLSIEPGHFDFGDTSCILPSAQVFAYALAIATSGRASRITLAGFDGYGPDDPRNQEMDKLIAEYAALKAALPLVSITASRYAVRQASVYAPATTQGVS